MNTIAVNFAHYHNFQTLYIDTKKDFSGIRIHQMIETRGINEKCCGAIMQQIKCERIYDIDGFLNIVKELLRTIDKYNEYKLLIVDSLPSLWYPLFGEKTSYGKFKI